MNDNEKNNSLFEADLFNYFYLNERNRQKNTLNTVFIETIKIVASILIALIINLISQIKKMNEIRITVVATICFTVIYAVLQIITFSSKKIYDAINNKRSRTEVIRINELLFRRIVINYANRAISIVKDIENNKITEEELCINCIKIAINCFEKSKSVFREILPEEEANKRGKREIANAIYLSHIGYSEIKMFFDSSQKNLQKLLALAEPLTSIYNDDILELLTFFQTNLPRITALEHVFNTLE